MIANLVLIPAASPALGIFGPGYADQATTALHIMALGVFPLTFKTHYVAIHRVQRRLGAALPIVWGGTLLELGGGAARRDPGWPHRSRLGLARGPVRGGTRDEQGRDSRPACPTRRGAPRPVPAGEELVAITSLDAPTFERP